jgi:hypothetical protein
MRGTVKIRVAMACVAILALTAPALAGRQAGAPVVIDSAIAVVNNQVILASDLEREMRLSVLEPPGASGEVRDRRSSLEQMISRELIQQQIRKGDVQASAPSDALLEARLSEMRKELPVCVQFHCATDQGWVSFLVTNGLTMDEVKGYLRLRLEILAFIENRFRQGIRIPRADVEDYYRKVLLPKYPATQAPPPLETVAPRIEEILLQQQVNTMFDAWLENLRKQGDIEILDPALAPAAATASNGVGR